MADEAEDNKLNYQQTESSRLIFFRRWTKILTVVSSVLLLTCVFLIVGSVLLVQSEDRLRQDNSDLKSQIALAQSFSGASSNTVNDAESTDRSPIQGLDTTKLLAKKDVGADQIPDHYTGNQHAKVIVVEYEDFACPHCQALHVTAQKIHSDYGDKVLFIHRSFNLNFDNSEITLSAAEAAYLIGGEKAYWQMTDLLYDDTAWSSGTVNLSDAVSKLSDDAKQIGLESNKFSKVLSNRANNGIASKLERDKEAGIAANVKGTPTWLINGQSVTPTESNIRAALDKALQ